jgi:acetyl esterase
MRSTAIHPQCKAFLDMIAAGGGKPLEQLPVADGREMARAMNELGGPVEDVALVENRSVPGPAQPIPVRVYRPSSADRLPGLMFFHGGGFVIGNLDSHDRQCRALANLAGAVVIAVDYRRAPEDKFPAAADDAYAATEYVVSHPAEFGIDPQRLGVAGDSAGANLATVVALMARDRQGPSLKFQLLVYPVVDFDDESPSMHEFGHDHFLTRETMDWFAEQYVAPSERRNPYAAPWYAADLRGLPPAMVLTAECDPLRDQGEAYARRLQQAGVAVEQKRYEGMIHPFLSLGGIVDSAKAAIADAAAAVRRAV